MESSSAISVAVVGSRPGAAIAGTGRSRRTTRDTVRHAEQNLLHLRGGRIIGRGVNTHTPRRRESLMHRTPIRSHLRRLTLALVVLAVFLVAAPLATAASVIGGSA